MTSNPTQDAIDAFTSFTSCSDEALATKFLQGAGHNTEAAINNYFENPDRYNQVYPPLDSQLYEWADPFKSNQSYDEAAFSQDRYGEQTENLPCTHSSWLHFPRPLLTAT